MSMFDDLEKRTDEDLLRMIESTTQGNPYAVNVERILKLRDGRRQLEMSNALVKATDKLVETTGKLGTATWVLAAITFLMFLTAGAQVWLTYKGIK